MALMDFYRRVIQALDEINAPYMIVGAYAGSIFGIARSTADVDILVDLRDEDFVALSQRFPLPRYYADPEMMRDSVRMGIMFNLIDTNLGVKADLVPLKREPEYRPAFDRRARRPFLDENGEVLFNAWVAQPSDIIVGKLMAWNEGRSSKHPSDIFDMLRFELDGFGEIPIDYNLISLAAARISPEALDMWNDVVARAQSEAKSHRASP